jgi:hypothetical protein
MYHRPERGALTGVSTPCQRLPIIRQSADAFGFAAKTLPTMEHHKAMADDLASKRKLAAAGAPGGDQLSEQNVFVCRAPGRAAAFAGLGFDVCSGLGTWLGVPSAGVGFR